MIKVLIVDDLNLFRDCLIKMIETDPEIEVIGGAANGTEAIALARIHSPNVVLMDLMMPECDGIDATKIIKVENPAIKVLVLTTSSSDDSVTNAIANGADGYVLKNISAEDLIISIKAVNSGMGILHKGLQLLSFEKNRTVTKGTNSRIYIKINDINIDLSERELAIIKYIVDGKSNLEIAESLFITEGRLRNIITKIISKLMLKDRTQLAVFALRNHLV